MAFTEQQIKLCTDNAELWLNSALKSRKAYWIINQNIHSRQELLNECIIHSSKYWKPDKDYSFKGHCHKYFGYKISLIVKEIMKKAEEKKKEKPEPITPFFNSDDKESEESFLFKISVDMAADRIERKEMESGKIVDPDTARYSGTSRLFCQLIRKYHANFLNPNPDLSLVKKEMTSKRVNWKNWHYRYTLFREFVREIKDRI